MGLVSKFMSLPGVGKAGEVGREIGLTGPMVRNFAGGTVLFTGIEMLTAKESLPSALGKGIVDSALWAVAPGIMTGLVVGQMGYGLASSIIGSAEQKYHENRQLYSRLNQPFQNKFQDSQRAYTMRQAAVQAIAGSKLNARSAIGGEAKLMHRPWQSIYS